MRFRFWSAQGAKFAATVVEIAVNNAVPSLQLRWDGRAHLWKLVIYREDRGWGGQAPENRRAYLWLNCAINLGYIQIFLTAGDVLCGNILLPSTWNRKCSWWGGCRHFSLPLQFSVLPRPVLSWLWTPSIRINSYLDGFLTMLKMQTGHLKGHMNLTWNTCKGVFFPVKFSNPIT